MTERRLAAEFRTPAGRQPSEAEIDQARLSYDMHIPSMFTHQCLGCDERWPCLTYREALEMLRLAGLAPDA